MAESPVENLYLPQYASTDSTSCKVPAGTMTASFECTGRYRQSTKGLAHIVFSDTHAGDSDALECSRRDWKDARLVKAAFATLGFPLTDIGVLHTDRGSEFANSGIDGLLEAFGIRRSLSRKGNPYDNAVIESTNRILKKEFVYQRAFASLDQLRRELNSYVRWYNEERIHSTLGYMSPVEFREAGLSL